MGNTALVSSGGGFFKGSSGRWAGERMQAAMLAGQTITPQVMRMGSVLRKDEWIELDTVLVGSAVRRLRGIADLRAAGLTKPLKGGLAKTIYQYQKIGDLGPAGVSMDGRARTENDGLEFDLASVPLPIIHKEFSLDLRTLLASRNTGEGLDTTQSDICGRKIAEKLESMLFLGGPQFGGLPIYGYTNHPNRLEMDYTDAEWTANTVDGADILKDILTAIAALKARRMYGPYGVYLPSEYEVLLGNDFKANGDLTIRQRLEQVESIKFLTVADMMPSETVAVVQMTPDVVTLIDGEPLQNVQWDLDGGWTIVFKAFTLQVPLLRSSSEDKTGIIIIKNSPDSDLLPGADTPLSDA